MQIAGVAGSFPSRIVTNDDVLAIIAEAPSDVGPAEREAYLATTRRLLEHAGSDRRAWLAPGERPADHVMRAIEGALDDAGLAKQDVDAFVYASVSRGFLEPAESFVVAKNAGLRPTHCFDVLEACNSFSRAAMIAQAMIASGEARNVLIAVAEFCVNGSAYVQGNFRPGTLDELEWRFPSYTLGECAAAMVLSPGGERWPFLVRTRADLADLCVVPLPDAPGYAPEMDAERSARARFTSYGRPMHKAALEASRSLWDELASTEPAMLRDATILFPHAPSRKLCEDFSAIAGLPDGFVFQLFTRCGNVGSASVPLGVRLARDEGRLRRGDRALCLVGAAGMSFMLYSFRY